MVGIESWFCNYQSRPFIRIASSAIPDLNPEKFSDSNFLLECVEHVILIIFFIWRFFFIYLITQFRDSFYLSIFFPFSFSNVVNPFSNSTNDWSFTRAPKLRGIFPMRPGFDLNSNDFMVSLLIFPFIYKEKKTDATHVINNTLV